MLSRLGPASSLAASFFFHFLTESMCLSPSEKKAALRSRRNLDQDLSLLGKWPAITLKASRLSFLTTAKS